MQALRSLLLLRFGIPGRTVRPQSPSVLPAFRQERTPFKETHKEKKYMKHTIEIFSAGCKTCNDTIDTVKKLAGSEHEVHVHDMHREDIAKRASSEVSETADPGLLKLGSACVVAAVRAVVISSRDKSHSYFLSHPGVTWMLPEDSTRRSRQRSGHEGYDLPRGCGSCYLVGGFRAGESYVFYHRMD
jgi:hypothetical protein